MLKKTLLMAFLVGGTSLFSIPGWSHCQIPCGIYHDDLVFGKLMENVTTIEKSVREIDSLSEKEQTALTVNSMTRWVINKEKHADDIATVMAQYFLQQRLKLDDANLGVKLTKAHRVMVMAMKVKQTVNLEIVDELKKSIQDFQGSYE
jgi:nickel superoxide dismutase